MGIEFSFSSNSASRHVGAALINLDEILRESGFLHVLGQSAFRKEEKNTRGSDTCRKDGFLPLGRKRKVHVNLGQPSLIHGRKNKLP